MTNDSEEMWEAGTRVKHWMDFFRKKSAKPSLSKVVANRRSAPQLVSDLLVQYDPSLEELLANPPADHPLVRVNGVSVPVARLPFAKLGEFFRELYDLSNREFFSDDLPPCKLAWNRRFRSLGGRIDCRKRLVELSSAHFEACGAAALGIVLVHEQIHLDLFERRRPYGHSADFKSKSLSVGLPTIHHEMPLPQRLQKPKKFHLYHCKCGLVVRSRKRYRLARACAACCKKFSRGRFDERFLLRYSGSEILHG